MCVTERDRKAEMHLGHEAAWLNQADTDAPRDKFPSEAISNRFHSMLAGAVSTHVGKRDQSCHAADEHYACRLTWCQEEEDERRRM